LRAVTTVCASKHFGADRLWLNGQEEAVTERFVTCLRELRARAQPRVVGGRTVVSGREEWEQYRVHVVSVNTFPTAAGLASSAAGYACLVYSLAQLFCVEEAYPGELSTIARQGSGSACRSLYGGFVRWQKGSDEATATDSMAVQVADEAHWPEMRALVLVASAAKKKVSSTNGMGNSVATSPLLTHRAAELVQPRVDAIEAAYRARDFETFGKLTMMDSNQFHATCLDTHPPIFYLNDVSREVIRAVHAYNEWAGRCVAAYTFDAGPNAVLYCLDADVPALLATLLALFPPPFESEAMPPHFTNANAVGVLQSALRAAPAAAQGPAAAACQTALASATPSVGMLTSILYTRCGAGPQRLTAAGAAVALLDVATGLPKPEAQAIAFGAVGDALAQRLAPDASTAESPKL
jgi:diphosphomevalonate decarboxylase